MIAFQGARDGQLQFDYFVTGLTGALFAYIAQTYKPQIFGFQPSSLEPLALIFLAISFFLGLKRIEGTIFSMKLNHQALDAAEKAGNTTKAIAENNGGSCFNEESGEYISANELPLRRQQFMLQAKAAREVLEGVVNKGQRYYVYRNHFLLAGFASILFGKLLEPYF